MEIIARNNSGPAVEDVQERLVKLGFEIDASEVASCIFGSSTEQAVRAFRKSFGCKDGAEIDDSCWQALVDAGYTLGDRTLYLRVPNFHGHDVEMLQTALNVLGFHAGAVDGTYGAHTEAAVKQFQENIGELGDGMCFPDTATAILRLHHVWEGQSGKDSPLNGRPLGFARAAEVLEASTIALLGTDPITRSIAARIWNLAIATTESSKLQLLNSLDDLPEDTALLLELNCEIGRPSRGVTLVTITSGNTDLGIRINMAKEMSRTKPPHVILKMSHEVNDYSGGFTAAKAQTLASTILDALCSAASSNHK